MSMQWKTPKDIAIQQHYKIISTVLTDDVREFFFQIRHQVGCMKPPCFLCVSSCCLLIIPIECNARPVPKKNAKINELSDVRAQILSRQVYSRQGFLHKVIFEALLQRRHHFRVQREREEQQDLGRYRELQKKLKVQSVAGGLNN